MREVDPAVLAEIRRAAFDVRGEDPQEAVRILRRAAAEGGEAEVLARGALGEIYLDELGDLDGAEHEYRAVLDLSPGLAAAELGLARALEEQGRIREALGALDRAIDSLARDARSFRERKAAGEPIPAGAEEVVLTLLEAALERAGLARVAALPTSRAPSEMDEVEEIAGWAERERLFDALREEDEDPGEDWARFHSLRAELLRSALADAESRLAAASGEERAQLEDAARRYREALASAPAELVQLKLGR